MRAEDNQMLEEGFSFLNTKTLGNIAVVLDASSSAWEYQDVILQVAVHLFETLPAGISKKLYFLSNSKEYDFNRLSRDAPKWWRENNFRGSFLTPILERLGNCKVVVIGSGLIYDLEDWRDSEWASKLFFVKAGESLRAALAIGEEVDCIQLPELLSRLHDPIVSVEIGGIAFMPYYWSNHGYKLSLGRENHLRGSSLEDFSTALAFFGNGVKARIRRASGAEEEVPLECLMPEIKEEWEALTKEEAEVFKKAVKDEQFVCLICGKRHSPSTLKCYQGASILGQPVYPSFGTRRGFVAFKETHSAVLFSFHIVNSIKIGEGKVAIASGSRAKVYEYNPLEERWLERGELKPYCAFGGKYLVVT